MFSDNLIEMSRDRRNFIKKVTLGAAAMSFNLYFPSEVSHSVPVEPGESTVSFITGNDRREMIYKALKPLEKDIRKGIKNKQVVIKCNLVGPEVLCGAHVDAVRGILDFLKPIYKKRIIVGDSTGRTYPGPLSTFKHFETHNYLNLPKEYKIKLVDFNDRKTRVLWMVDQDMHPLGINFIDTFLDPDNYIISMTRLKTHGDVIVTLSVKNIVMGSPISHYKQKKVEGRNEKALMHSGGIKNINFNIFLAAHHVQPQLSVIDGLVGMEGNGPTDGTPVEHGVALAGTDMIAVDRMAVELMGVDFNDIGYLTYCANAGMGQSDLSKINIIGENPYDHIIKYRLHKNIKRQLTWKEGLVIDK